MRVVEGIVIRHATIHIQRREWIRKSIGKSRHHWLLHLIFERHNRHPVWTVILTLVAVQPPWRKKDGKRSRSHRSRLQSVPSAIRSSQGVVQVSNRLIGPGILSRLADLKARAIREKECALLD